jgi:hypothetical protein
MIWRNLFSENAAIYGPGSISVHPNLKRVLLAIWRSFNSYLLLQAEGDSNCLAYYKIKKKSKLQEFYRGMLSGPFLTDGLRISSGCSYIRTFSTQCSSFSEPNNLYIYIFTPFEANIISHL